MRPILMSTVFATGLAAACAAMAADAAPPPPSAPVFYCPAPSAPAAAGAHATSGGCPTVSAGRSWSSHHARAVTSRSHVSRRHQRRAAVRVTVRERSWVAPPTRGNEDDGVSASQAWVYRYQAERGGFHPWEVEGDRYRQQDDYAWRDERRMRDWSEEPPPPPGDDESGYGQDDSAYRQDNDERSGSYEDEGRDSYRHDERDDDSYRRDERAGGASEHHFAYERREMDDHGGSVHGSVDGDRYRYSWGERSDDRRQGGRHHHGDRHDRHDDDEMHAYTGGGAHYEDGYGEGDFSGGRAYADRYERSQHDAGGYAHRSGGGYNYSEQNSSSYGGGYGDSYAGAGRWGWSGGSSGYGGDRYGWSGGGYAFTGDPVYANGPQGGGQYVWRYGQGGGYETYDYAGRDEHGYLVWSGKPRRP